MSTEQKKALIGSEPKKGKGFNTEPHKSTENIGNLNSKTAASINDNSPTEKKHRKERGPRKKHNISLSQLMSWESFNSSGARASQSSFILALAKLHTEPRTRRQLEEESGIQRTNLCRIMCDLVDDGLLIVCDELVKCKYSKSYVQQYKINPAPISRETFTAILSPEQQKEIAPTTGQASFFDGNLQPKKEVSHG